jgi:hypothetical protein
MPRAAAADAMAIVTSRERPGRGIVRFIMEAGLLSE